MKSAFFKRFWALLRLANLLLFYKNVKESIIAIALVHEKLFVIYCKKGGYGEKRDQEVIEYKP